MKRAMIFVQAGLAVVLAFGGVVGSFGQDKTNPPSKSAPPPGKQNPAVDPAQAMAQMRQQFLQQFDLDKDGKLNAQESAMAQEVMQRQGINLGVPPSGFPGAEEFAKQFDMDGDGKLSPVEGAMAQQAYQRMRRGGNAAGGPQVGGGGGSSPPPPATPVAPVGDGKAKKVNPLVKRFDKDGDGKLNDEEKATAQAELKKDKGKEKDAKKDDAKKDKAKKDK